MGDNSQPDYVYYRGKFKVESCVSTARTTNAWASEDRKQTIPAVAVYANNRELSAERISTIKEIANELDLREVEHARDEGQGKIVFTEKD